ncbi:MAG: TonB C-terminal domain-containing protein [Acidobacteriota bacterium]|nr:TonB C-terminal domain-containing protein [Acidobacteriota bacterium]
MYFDFDGRYSDIEPVGRAINRRDGVVVSLLVHAAAIALLLFAPEWLPTRAPSPDADIVRLEQERKTEAPRFVFVQPKIDTPAPKPPDRAELSDVDRRARAVERPPAIDNPLPFSRGNSSERVEARTEELARGKGPAETPAPETPPSVEVPDRAADPSPEGRLALRKPQPAAPPPGGQLGEALRNLQRYVDQESFDNPRGNVQEFGPAIQFDTKGVEFGPWIRRFVAQVKRNWFVPYAAMSLKGRVIITFFVHRDGTLTDVTVISPSSVESFNLAARNALLASSPTEPLPPEYPDDKAFFTVTFFYNESPDGRAPQER